MKYNVVSTIVLLEHLAILYVLFTGEAAKKLDDELKK